MLMQYSIIPKEYASARIGSVDVSWRILGAANGCMRGWICSILGEKHGVDGDVCEQSSCKVILWRCIDDSERDTAWEVVRDSKGRVNMGISGRGSGSSEGGWKMEVMEVEWPKPRILSVLVCVMSMLRRDKSLCERPNEWR